MSFDIFLSYAHEQQSEAIALRRALQQLAKPIFKRQALRVFHDEASIRVTPAAWDEIEAALLQSKYMVLLVSPESAKSEWVRREVAFWLEFKPVERILLAQVADGQIFWNDADGDFDWTLSTLPSCLSRAFMTEPLWTRIPSVPRTESWRSDPELVSAAAMIAARVRGLRKEDLYSEDLRIHRRVLALTGAGVGVVMVVAAVAVYFAVATARALARSETSLKTTRAISMSTQAINSLRSDTYLALSLAKEAASIENSPTTNLALEMSALNCWQVGMIKTHDNNYVEASQVDDHGNVLVLYSNGSVWDYESSTFRGRQLTQLPFKGDEGYTFSPQSRTLASWNGESGVLYDFTSSALRKIPLIAGKRRPASPLEDTESSVRPTFSPDGADLLVSSEGSYLIFRVADGKLKVDQPQAGRAFAGWNTSGKRFTPMFLRLTELKTRWEREQHFSSFELASNGSDGVLVTIPTPGVGRIIHRPTGKTIRQIRTENMNFECYFSASGKYLVVEEGNNLNGHDIDPDRVARVYEASTGRFLFRTDEHDDTVFDSCGLPNTETLLTFSRDGTIGVYDIDNRILVKRLVGHSSPIQSFDVSPSGSYLATTSEGELRVWNLLVKRKPSLRERSVIRSLDTEEEDTLPEYPTLAVWSQRQSTQAIRELGMESPQGRKESSTQTAATRIMKGGKVVIVSTTSSEVRSVQVGSAGDQATELFNLKIDELPWRIKSPRSTLASVVISRNGSGILSLLIQRSQGEQVAREVLHVAYDIERRNLRITPLPDYPSIDSLHIRGNTLSKATAIADADTGRVWVYDERSGTIKGPAWSDQRLVSVDFIDSGRYIILNPETPELYVFRTEDMRFIARLPCKDWSLSGDTGNILLQAGNSIQIFSSRHGVVLAEIPVSRFEAEAVQADGYLPSPIEDDRYPILLGWVAESRAIAVEQAGEQWLIPLPRW